MCIAYLWLWTVVRGAIVPSVCPRYLGVYRSNMYGYLGVYRIIYNLSRVTQEYVHIYIYK